MRDSLDVGRRVVDALGEGAARELLGVLERQSSDRAALIRRMYVRGDAQWLAELLMDLEDDDVARWRLEAGVRSVLRLPGGSP